MQFSPTSKFSAIARGTGKYVQWICYIKLTASLTEALTSGTWIDVTDRIVSFPTIDNTIEMETAQFTANAITLTGQGIKWWNSNILNYANNIEVKVTLQIGLSQTNLATDIAYAFTGWLDKVGMQPLETMDQVQFNVYSYDELGNRTSAEATLMQILNKNVDGAGTSGLVLMSIPGIYVTNANVASYVLKKGIHTLTYTYNGGSPKVALDDGAATAVAGSTTIQTQDGSQKVTVYANLSAVAPTDGLTQSVVVNNEGDTIPKTWMGYLQVYQLLKNLYSQIGLTNYLFDDFRIATYDGRYVSSFFDVPPATTFYDKPGCVGWDGTNNLLLVGVGNKIYVRNMTLNTYTDQGSIISGGQPCRVIRIWLDNMASHSEYWALARDPSNNNVLVRGTYAGGITTIKNLSNRGNLEAGDYTSHNFAYVAGFGANGSIVYCNTGVGSTAVWRFDLSSHGEISVSTGAYTISPAVAGWSDGTYYFLGLSGNILQYTSAGVITVLASPGTAIYDGAYDASINSFVFAKTGTAGIYQYSHGSNSFSTVSATGTPTNFLYTSTLGGYPAVLLILATSGIQAFGYVQVGVYSALSGVITYPLTCDTIGDPYQVTWDPVGQRLLGLNSISGVLFQYYTKASMHVGPEADFTNLTIGDAIRLGAIAYDLMPFASMTKTAYCYRRGDDSGNPVTSGNTVTLTNDDVADIPETTAYVLAYDVVQVTNGIDTWNYDGTTMRQGTYVALALERVLEISNALIPTELLKDIAYYYRQYFKTARNLYQVPLANVILLQYEPFDGATLSLAGTQIGVNASGIIVETQVDQYGCPTLGVLI